MDVYNRDKQVNLDILINKPFSFFWSKANLFLNFPQGLPNLGTLGHVPPVLFQSVEMNIRKKTPSEKIKKTT